MKGFAAVLVALLGAFSAGVGLAYVGTYEDDTGASCAMLTIGTSEVNVCLGEEGPGPVPNGVDPERIVSDPALGFE